MTDIMDSPYKSATDSPSRQLLWELSQLAVSNQQGFYAHLDRENDERAAQHKQALAKASAKHDRVRRSAEEYRERLALQIEAENRRREEESKRELDRQRQQHAAEEEAARKRDAERAKAAEIERRRASETRRAEVEAKRAEAEVERAEAEAAKKTQREIDAAQRLKDEQAKAAQQKAQATAAKAKARDATIVAEKACPPAYEEEHKRYLDIHRRLKELRTFMSVQAGKNSQLKSEMGEMRRQIKKNVGQIQEAKRENRTQLSSIMGILRKAKSLTGGPTINVTLFLASPPTQVDDSNGPALLVFLLNIFAKGIIAQFLNEAGIKTQMADSIGTVASHIFALEDFRWKGITLIDIMIAKLHVVCPPLFGIYGDERSIQGKTRLGWLRGEEGGPFISQQDHFQRMTGCGAGFASISLRNYEKAQLQNPFPPSKYWQALARITNVPPNQITETHFVILRSMIDGSETHFLQFYGDAGLAALRHALIELPKRSPQSVSSKGLFWLVDKLQREKKLTL